MIQHNPYDRLIASLPFGAEAELIFEPKDIANSLALQQAINRRGIAAAYSDYYGRATVQFGMTDEARRASSDDHAPMVPRSAWRDWNVVQSGAQVYVEPIETHVLERGAVAHNAEDLIPQLVAELRADTPQDAVADKLRLLGHVPLGLETLQPLESHATSTLRIEESVVEFHHINGPVAVVHTPCRPVDALIYTDESALRLAQAAGTIDSVYFDADGTFEPEGMTHPLHGSRIGIAVMQAKFLRRWIRKAELVASAL